MPKTRLDKFAQPKRDPLKGLILEYQKALHWSDTQLAQAMGCSYSTFYRRLNKAHSSTWLSPALTVCRAMNIPIEAVRSCINY